VLNALFAGPTQAEAASGLQTAVPAQTKVLSTTIANGVATVNLNSAFSQVVGPAQIQAAAQIVYTATGLAGVSGVTFAIGGQAVAVPVSGGAQVSVADRGQFPGLAPTG
jgi:spore germination protein GerM